MGDLDIKSLLDEDIDNKKSIPKTYRMSPKQDRQLKEVIEYYGLGTTAKWIDLMIQNSYNGMKVDKENS